MVFAFELFFVFGCFVVTMPSGVPASVGRPSSTRLVADRLGTVLHIMGIGETTVRGAAGRGANGPTVPAAARVGLPCAVSRGGAGAGDCGLSRVNPVPSTFAAADGGAAVAVFAAVTAIPFAIAAIAVAGMTPMNSTAIAVFAASL